MRRGATLIEVLMSIAIASLLLLAGAQIARVTFVLFTRAQAHTLAQSGGQLGVDRFAADIRRAETHVLTIATSGLTASPDVIPVAISFRQKENGGQGLMPRFSKGPQFVIYFFNQTRSQWLRGEWTPDTAPPCGNDLSYALTPARLSGILSTPPAVTGLDAPPKVLTQNVSSIAVTPSAWPGWPFDLTQGVCLTLTIHYDYLTGAANGLQSLNGSFTKTFVTQAYPREHE